MDDATSEVMTARFEMSETTKGYFRLMRDHLIAYGRPLSLYIDKHGVFKLNHKGAISGTGQTQFVLFLTLRFFPEINVKTSCRSIVNESYR